MTTDRAGPEGTIGRGERRLVVRQGFMGFFSAAWEFVPDPWMPPPSTFQAIIDRVREAETPAKPVGGVSRSPDSSS